ncbi:hypothetical protein LOK49_Contig31G00006, partial [Camellia lanceoleosa]
RNVAGGSEESVLLSQIDENAKDDSGNKEMDSLKNNDFWCLCLNESDMLFCPECLLRCCF